MKTQEKNKNWIKNIFKILYKSVKFFVVFWIFLFLIMLIPAVQSRLANFVLSKVNDAYNVDIKADKFTLSINGGVVLHHILIKDFKQDTLISAKKLETSIADIPNLLSGNLYFGNIYGENLWLNMVTYKGDSISNLDVFSNSFDSGKPPSAKPFIMKSKGIFLQNSKFSVTDYNHHSPEMVKIDSIFANVSDFLIEGSDVKLKAHSGHMIIDKYLKINDLKTYFSYTDSVISSKEMTLKTPFSTIEGQIEFFSKNKSYGKFLDNVRLEAVFKNSKISTSDLNQFYNGFAFDKILNFRGKMSGTLNNLYVESSEIDYQSTKIEGNYHFLNSFGDRKFNMKANFEEFSSTYADLTSLMPDFLGENLPEELIGLGYFSSLGSLALSKDVLETNLDFVSNAGKFSIEGVITEFDDLKNSSYKGNLSLEDFNLGEIFSNQKLKNATGNVHFFGKGLTSIEKVLVNGKISSLNFNHYTYKNIKIDTEYLDQNIKTDVKILDSNLDLSLNGFALLGKNKDNSYDFSAKIRNANINHLGFLQDSIATINGDFSLIGKGELENISAEIALKNVNLQRNNTKFDFDSFLVNLDFSDKENQKILLKSKDIVSGEISGKFVLTEFNKVLINSIGSIYTNYTPFKVSEGQFLDFNLQFHNKVIQAIFPEVRISQNTFLKGKIIADQGDFKLNFKSPEIHFSDNKLKKINLLVDNKNPLYNTFFEVSKIQTPFYNFSDFNLINTTINDTLFFRTEFSGEKKDAYTLNFYHTINKNQSSVIGVKKSKIFFKNKEWILNNSNDKNRVIFNRKLDSIQIENFKLEHQNQSISFEGKTYKDIYKDLHLVLNRIQLEDIMPDVQGFKLEGEANGHLSLIQDKNRYYPLSSLTIERFYLNDYELGDLEMEIQGGDDLSSFKVNTHILNSKQESLQAVGDIFVGSKDTHLDLFLNLQDFNIKPFSTPLDGILSNVRGNLDGQAHIFGKLSSPKTSGKISVKNAGLAVPYLNVDVDFSPNSEILINTNALTFNNIKLTDTAYKTEAVLTGGISHKKFSQWFLNINLDTQNKRFLALNTTALDNDLFYGLGFINGKASISGYTDDLSIKIKAETSEGTKFKIPLSDTQSVGDDSFIHFVNKKKADEQEDLTEVSVNSGIEMQFDVSIMPSAEVEIIMDKKTGANLIGRGYGTLLLDINTNGKFNMWGDYIVNAGEYNFKYEGIIDKKFKVLPGGSITWNGNPLNAELSNLKAVYNLYSNPSILIESAQHNRKIQTQVQVNLEGSLSNPKPVFDIKFPDSNPALVAELDYILRDVDKKQLQAFSLLLQGNFMSDATAGERIVSHNMFETAAGLFNDLLSTENDKLNLGLSYEAGASNPNELQNYSDRLGITVSTEITEKILFNGKLGIPLGGATQTAIAGDFEIQFLLNEKGTLSAKIFNRENQVQQYLLDKIGYTQGIGLSYKVDFNTFRELIWGILRKREENEVPKKD